MVAALPIAKAEASWIISCVPGDITRSSAAATMKDAADAARPSTTAVTLALWARSMFRIARPSHTSPPGELIRSRISLTSPTSSSAVATSLAEIPKKPPQESIGPYMRMVATPVPPVC
jgi:hypothetical protein